MDDHTTEAATPSTARYETWRPESVLLLFMSISVVLMNLTIVVAFMRKNVRDLTHALIYLTQNLYISNLVFQCSSTL